MVPANAELHSYYIPYNKLLYTTFPPSSHFAVAPQLYPLLDSPRSRSRRFGYEIWWNEYPVFVLQLKDPRTINSAEAREEADREMRHRLRGVIDRCPLPTLHAVSAFGTKLSFFEYPKDGNILPACIQGDEGDKVPMERWSYDLLELAGGNKLRALLEAIKESHIETKIEPIW
jgi:hypothetical protein